MYKSFVLINLFMIAIILWIVQIQLSMYNAQEHLIIDGLNSEWPEAFKYFANQEIKDSEIQKSVLN